MSGRRRSFAARALVALAVAGTLAAACGGAEHAGPTGSPPPGASAGPTVTGSPPPVARRSPIAGTAGGDGRTGVRATAQPADPPVPPDDVVDGPTHRVATRVVVRELGIDLPVTRQRASYPPCNVAMYLVELNQPGQGGPTYLYAHARRGMFLPLLEQSLVNDGKGMLGMTVAVYTGDNRRFVYRIDEVRRHARDLRWVERRTGESLWLQTSEGPAGTIPKLQVGASLVSSGPADHADAHPRPRPVRC